MKAKLHFVKPFLLISLITTLVFLLFLPFLCDTYLLPRLAQQLPFSHKELSLSKITPWKIRGTLRLIQNGVLVTNIPKFEIQYSLASLLKREIDTILIDSPTLHLRYSDGAFSIPGLPNKPSSTEKSTNNISITSPVSIKNIIIRNSRITLQKETKVYNVIVDSQIQLGFTLQKEKKFKLSTLLIDTATGGDLTVKSYLHGVFSPKGMLFNVKINTSDLTEINDLIPDNQNITITGALAASGQIALAPDMTISHCLVDAEIDTFTSTFNQFTFTQTTAQKPVHIHLEGDNQTLHIETSGFSTKEPEETDITTTGQIDIQNKSAVGTATVHSPRLNSQFTVAMNGKINSETTLAHLTITGDRFAIGADTSVGQVAVNADVFYKDTIVTAQVTGTVSDIQSLSNDLFLENINWDIPLQFPLQINNPEKKAQINVHSLQYKNIETAGLSASLQQTTEGFNYTADLVSKMDFSGKIECNGSVFFNGDTTSSCTLPNTTIDSSLLPDYIKIPEGKVFRGILAANGAFERTGAKRKGNLTLHISDGTLTSGATVLEEIETTISFANLPNVRSEPGQLATIGSIQSGKIHLQNGRVFFRIENERQLLLEKARLSWCGGKVELGSLTLNSDMKDLEATLYCDRIRFAELLKQFGIEDTEGEGSLNGRLPVAINDKGISFDDGFLFSTPGNSGIVRFNNTDQLREGMPDIGQTATLDYSVKALENFAYNWTKLSFNTEGKDLLLTMQLDGKPAAPLPFGYKSGQIVATEQGPGLQHPVRLDMNFRLPLQELFQSGKSLQSFMEKM